MGIHIDDLSFRRDLFQLAEAMQYAFNSEPKSDYDKQNKRYWVGQVLSSSKPDVAKEINAIKTKYADELANLHFYLAFWICILQQAKQMIEKNSKKSI
ncbi:MAG: hypothetical protein IKA31_01440 [Clostridia bacterium]|nr:hypothetical protein [Clostridia bacterium]